jgi:hypothetical protein
MKSATTKRIDGNEYEFFQLGPRDAIRTVTKLVKVLGPAFTKAAGGTKIPNGGSILDADVDLAGAMSILSDKLDEDEVIGIIETMFEVTFFKGQKLNFEHPNFQGAPMHLLKVVLESLKANFDDFFVVASGGLSRVTSDTTPASSTSTLGSGGSS